jgi:hypothetical protein
VWYRDEQIVVKQTIKGLTVVTILKNFNKPRMHGLIKKRANVLQGNSLVRDPKLLSINAFKYAWM